MSTKCAFGCRIRVCFAAILVRGEGPDIYTAPGHAAEELDAQSCCSKVCWATRLKLIAANVVSRRGVAMFQARWDQHQPVMVPSSAQIMRLVSMRF